MAPAGAGGAARPAVTVSAAAGGGSGTAPAPGSRLTALLPQMNGAPRDAAEPAAVWERPWSLEEIRKGSQSWSLASDAGVSGAAGTGPGTGPGAGPGTGGERGSAPRLGAVYREVLPPAGPSSGRGSACPPRAARGGSSPPGHRWAAGGESSPGQRPAESPVALTIRSGREN